MQFTRLARQLALVLLGAVLLRYVYQDFSWQELSQGLANVKRGWVLLAMALHLLMHLTRALRWQQMLAAQGYQLALLRVLLAEMTGFFSNLFVPRLGEWTRCQALKRMAGVQVSRALAGVLLERALDVLSVTLMAMLILLLRPEALLSMLARVSHLLVSPLQVERWWSLPIGLALAALLAVSLFWRSGFFWEQVGGFFVSLAQGLVASLRKRRKQVGILTLCIWCCDLLMECACMMAMHATSALGPWVALHVMLLANVGTAIPVPGYLGSYHALVGLSLVSFGVPAAEALLYATLAHSLQLFNALVFGGLSALLSSQLTPKKQLIKVS